jgi:hypothetical protein
MSVEMFFPRLKTNESGKLRDTEGIRALVLFPGLLLMCVKYGPSLEFEHISLIHTEIYAKTLSCHDFVLNHFYS